MSAIKLQPHERRVVDEKAENDVRLGKLTAFMDTETFRSLDDQQQSLLKSQASLMRALSTVLGKRIAFFPSAGEVQEEATQGLGQVSDGYHTFDELYAQRTALFAALMRSHPEAAWWSHKHADGTSFPGYILAGIHTQEGHATYHLPESATPLMPYDSEYGRGPDWDGHTAADVIQRLASIEAAPNAEGFHPSHEAMKGPTNEVDCCAYCGVQARTEKAREVCRGFPHSHEEQRRARRP